MPLQNNNPDLISVIVPAYNAEKLISRTIDSLTKQVGVELEIIIVNDCSTDNTLSIIDRYAAQDSRIKVINLPANQGVHLARMRGLRCASGEYIGFVDADDYIAPTMYQKMLLDLKQTNSCIAICSVARVDLEGKLLNFSPKFRKNTYVDEQLVEDLTALKFGHAYLCNKLYKREVISEAVDYQFPWRQSLNEDMIINIGCFEKAKRVCLLTDVLYYYSKNVESATQNANKTKYYIEHVKAFALALEIYGKKSQKLEKAVYSFYRPYISMDKVFVEDVAELTQFEKELEAVSLYLAEVDKYALFKLAARNANTQVGSKKLLASMLKKLVDKYVFKRCQYEFIK